MQITVLGIVVHVSLLWTLRFAASDCLFENKNFFKQMGLWHPGFFTLRSLLYHCLSLLYYEPTLSSNAEVLSRETWLINFWVLFRGLMPLLCVTVTWLICSLQYQAFIIQYIYWSYRISKWVGSMLAILFLEQHHVYANGIVVVFLLYQLLALVCIMYPYRGSFLGSFSSLV